MRSLGIIGANIALIVLVGLLLDQLTTQALSEPDVVLISRFLIVTIGTSSAVLSTVQVPAAPVRVTRFALSSQRRIRRYTHEMFTASLVRELNATFAPGGTRHGRTTTGVRRLFSRCTRIPSIDMLQQFKARSVDTVCLRRGWHRA
ncbi:MAG: hypothetical protein IT324_24005 [Anaerolineae bacterium]|nr:hypothetical protein [Anaerolineae bacterium]